MNKKELVAMMAEISNQSKAISEKCLDAFMAAVEQALKSGQEVRLVGFGSFYVVSKAATTGRNPRTGDTIDIPASIQPKFRSGKGLKDAVN